jgi:mannan endo-1,4-beta-mannosidase
VKLYQFTVRYLRDVKQLHNVLYAFSPYWKLISYIPVIGPSLTDYRGDFLDRYPGDDFVDVFGYEQYRAIHPGRLSAVVKLALERDKIAAVTEAGIEGIPQPQWWTQKFLASLKATPYTRMAAYALLWRNDVTSPKHHYAPFPGHPSVADFLRMKEDGTVLFQDDLRDMYQ